MNRLILAVILAGSGIAHAEKPDLDRSRVVSLVACPDEATRACLLLNTGKKFYVVKGEGYGKEEKIWLIDNKKIEKANEKTPYTKYMKLVWQSMKGMT